MKLSPLFLFGVLALAGCTSDRQEDSQLNLITGFAKSFVGQRGGASTPRQKDLGLTDASLSQIQTPVDLVDIDDLNVTALVARVATNNGVETWSSVDHRTLALQDGVLLETRGLGDDLLHSTSPGLRALSSDGGTHTRTRVELDGDNHEIRKRFDCQVRLMGAQNIVIVERSYETRHFRESCAAGEISFQNDFWFGNGGKIRQSRQKATDRTGYVAIRHLSDRF